MTATRKRRTFTLNDLTPYGRKLVADAIERKREAAWAAADVNKARVYFPDSVGEYASDTLAYSVWLGMGRGVRCAFRAAGDATPVYSWDLVDRP
jgi:hypothetical protein